MHLDLAHTHTHTHRSLPPPPAEKHCTGASQPHPSQSDLNTSNESKSDSKNGTLSSQTQTNTTKNTDSAKHDHHSKNSKHKHKHKRDKRESKSNTSDAATDSKESLEHEPFEILLRKREIWLYRIPPNIWRSNRNNSAKQWNLREPLWTGHLRIVAFDHGNEIIFEFLNKNNSIYLQSVRIPLKKIILSQMSSNDTRIQKVSLTEESLANASSTSDGSILNLHDYFDAYGVIDSSRYFIIWVETPNIDEKLRKRIPLGFGMRERHDAFDIRAAVTDQLRRVKNSLNINGSNDGSKGSDASDDSDNGSGGSLEDDLSNIKLTEMFTLKENEMIAIGNHHKGNKSRIVTKSMETNENKNNKLDLNKLLLLPPPPEKKVVAIDTTQAPKSMAQVQQETVGSITNETEEETNIADWGDFQAATGSNDNDNEKEMIETNVSNDKKKEQEMEVANNSTE